MAQQNQIIPNNDNEVLSAMDNAAKVHESMANADMQQMALAGELGKDVLSVDNTFAKFIAKDNYYNSLGDAQMYMTKASQISATYKDKLLNLPVYDDKGNPIEPYNYYNKTNKEYNTYFNSFLQNIIDNKTMPNSIKAKLINNLNKSKQGFTDTYNKVTLKQVGSDDVSNFINAYYAHKNDGYSNIEVNNLMHNVNQILGNSEVSNDEKQKVLNIAHGISAMSSNPDAQNQTLPQQLNPHINESINNQNSSTAINNAVKGMFLNGGTNILQNVDLTKTKKSDLDNLIASMPEYSKIKTDISQSLNVPAYLQGMADNGDINQKIVANQLQPLLKNNMGDYILRGLSPELQGLYNAYNKNPNYNTWSAYSTSLHKHAEHAGIPFSNIGELPVDVDNTLTNLNKDYQNTNYANELYDSLAGIKTLMRDSPVYGTSDNANMVRLFNYGDESKSGFSSFIAGSNSNYAKEVGKLYKQTGGNIDDINDYIEKNQRDFKHISTVLQIPQSKFNDYVSTHLKDMINNGMTLSEAKNNMSDITQGYLNTGNSDIGDNYIVDKKIFANMGVTDSNLKSLIANNAINLAYNKQVNDLANQMYYGTPKPVINLQKTIDITLGKNILVSKPSDISTDTGDKSISLDGYKTRIRDNLGQPSEYSIIKSNGQLFVKNNFNDKELPINDTILKTAHDNIMDNIQEYQKQRGTWWNSVLDSETRF